MIEEMIVEMLGVIEEMTEGMIGETIEEMTEGIIDINNRIETIVQLNKNPKDIEHLKISKYKKTSNIVVSKEKHVAQHLTKLPNACKNPAKQPAKSAAIATPAETVVTATPNDLNTIIKI